MFLPLQTAFVTNPFLHMPFMKYKARVAAEKITTCGFQLLLMVVSKMSPQVVP